jgi:hypothetical protein
VSPAHVAVEAGQDAIPYLTGTALAEGTPESVAERTLAGLRAEGWNDSLGMPVLGGAGFITDDTFGTSVEVRVKSAVGDDAVPDGMSVLRIVVRPYGTP